VLADRGAVVAFQTQNAVQVRPGGLLIVQDADLTGRGRAIEQGDRFQPPAGEAIFAEGGFVRIVAGRIGGGNVLVSAQDPNTPPPPEPPGSGVPFNSRIRPRLASALFARDSVVEIEGGTLISSGAFGLNEDFARESAVAVVGSQLRIRGGTFQRGPAPSPGGSALSVFDSDVEISGGAFTAFVSLVGSRSQILGGQFSNDGLSLGLSTFVLLTPQGPGCAEIRGGSLRALTLNNSQESAFIAGTGFNVPLGPLPIPDLGQSVRMQLTGTLADGTPLDVALSAIPGSRVTLIAPGAVGCTP
jgi:hypothetical protein